MSKCQNCASLIYFESFSGDKGHYECNKGHFNSIQTLTISDCFDHEATDEIISLAPTIGQLKDGFRKLKDDTLERIITRSDPKNTLRSVLDEAKFVRDERIKQGVWDPESEKKRKAEKQAEQTRLIKSSGLIKNWGLWEIT